MRCGAAACACGAGRGASTAPRWLEDDEDKQRVRLKQQTAGTRAHHQLRFPFAWTKAGNVNNLLALSAATASKGAGEYVRVSMSG